MDIPTYSDIYSFPGGYLDKHHLHKHHQHFNPSQVIETSKSIDINDATGLRRYTVKLMSEETEEGLGFQVQVIHYFPSDSSIDPDFKLVIPSEGYEYDYAKAQNDFTICVERFNSLVKAEIKDFRDIDIYKEAIGYKRVQPNCCMFCKWSCLPSHEPTEKCLLECHNPKNQRKFQYTSNFPLPPPPKPPRNDGWQKLPWMPVNPMKQHDYEHMHPIYPRVELFGCCINFEKGLHKDYPTWIDGASLSTIVPNDPTLHNVEDEPGETNDGLIDTNDGDVESPPIDSTDTE